MNFIGRKDLPLVTLILLGISVLVSLYSSFGSQLEPIRGWFITEYLDAGLPEIRSGELWRLLSPIFLHFAWFHLAFNGIWMWQLGSIIETRLGPWGLLTLVVIIGSGSNLAQYLSTGPLFGGLSGVVYGLLGYFWIQGRCNPRFGLVLNNAVVYLMLGWFVLCWVGIIPNVANWAHTAGLGLGMGAAWISYRLGRP
ncbi:MAG: Rhomboid protease GlpG [Gammaproteobacteria bacterium]|nr:Rhomboid protease GlpG [Gammaproteobacteria bacterium]